jgi:replication factor C subunit 3/5
MRKSKYAIATVESATDRDQRESHGPDTPPPDWEALIEQIARQIVEERSAARLLQVRASLYDLLSHCIDSTTIIKTLTWKLIPMTEDALKPEVIKWAAHYEHRCKMGSKQIFHLEAFVAKYMRLYERYVKAYCDDKAASLTFTVTQWALILIQRKVSINSSQKEATFAKASQGRAFGVVK